MRKRRKQGRLAMKQAASIRGSSGPRVRKLDLLLVLCLIGWGSCHYLDNHPFELGASALPEGVGVPLDGSERAEVLLITVSAPESPETFADMSFSANWHNTLEQEFGPYRTVELDDFGPNSVGDVALVVVPRSASERATPGTIATLEQYVHDGGRLLVEMPLGPWAALVGVSVQASEVRETRRITAFDGSMVRGDLRDDVIQAPLATHMAPVQTAEFGSRDDLQVLMEVDGLPALLRRQLGRGEVFALYFDLGRAVGALQQGVPTVDWEVARPAMDLPVGFTRTASLVSHGDLRNGRSPAADLLERNLITTVTASRPTPRIWLYPGTSAGAYIMTHSADGPLAEGRFMLEWERTAELPSTVFIQSRHVDAPTRELIADPGVLLRPPTATGAPHSETTLFGTTIMRRPISAPDQIAEAVGPVGTQTQLMARMDEGLWDPEYGASFRHLAGLGVDIDSSLGPAFVATEPEAAVGYSFGTGLPFRPVDRNGQLLPFLEIPTVLNDGDALDLTTVETLIDRAAGVYNELIVADWRTGTMHRAPAADVVTSWRDGYERAAERGLWVTDLRTFARFWTLRRESSISSTFNPGERRLTVRVDTTALTDSASVGGEPLAPSVAFEARYDGRPIERITRNGQDVPFVELGRSADGVFQIFALPPGSNRLEITYQGPVTLTPPP